MYYNFYGHIDSFVNNFYFFGKLIDIFESAKIREDMLRLEKRSSSIRMAYI